MLKKRICVIICALYIITLVGCATVTPQGALPGAENEAELTHTDKDKDAGLFTLEDFADLIPGKSTIKDAEQVYNEYGISFMDWVKYQRLLPSIKETEMTVTASIPEWVVCSILWNTKDFASSNRSSTECEVDISPTPSVSAFFDIVPGSSDYQDFFRICGYDLGQFPRKECLYIEIPVLNDCFLSINFNTEGIVTRIAYFCKIDSIQPQCTFSLSEFFQNTPGQSTFDMINSQALASGYIWGSGDIPTPLNQKYHLLPASNGNRITLEGTWAENTIQSITIENLYDTYHRETDTIVVEVSSAAAFQIMADITPTQDTCQKISEICKYDFGEFPREKGLNIQIPMEKNCVLIILLDPDGYVKSITWKAADWISPAERQ